jgi:alpha-tubulin suppressor-like RCC1 family protein
MVARHSMLLALASISIACSDVGPAPPPERSADRLWIYATGLSLALGEKVRLGVTAADSAVSTYVQFPDYLGNPWPEDLHIRWWTSDPSRATVDDSGLITARTPGRTTMWVAVGATVDSGTLIVEPESGGPGFRAQSLHAGLLHTCGLDAAGLAYCWGSDFSGALGRGRIRQFNSAATPGAVTGGHAFAALTVGADFACGLTMVGSALCWGGNQWGQLGDGTDGSAFSEVGAFGRATPVAALGGHTFTSVRAGGFHVCALDATGQAFCWGLDSFGQLATGPYGGASSHRSEPTPAAGVLRFRSLGLGSLHSCAVGTDSLTYCWGLNDRAQLGIDTAASPGRCGGGWWCGTTPIALDSAFRFVAVTAGRVHSCGLTASGTAYCWGDGSPEPKPVAGLAFTTLEAGVNHTCGLTADGTAYCWGENDKGQIGDGTVTALRPTPVPVATPTKFRSLAPGGSHTCGVSGDGQGFCWGWNRRGQIGNGAIEGPNATTHGVVPLPAHVRPPLF